MYHTSTLFFKFIVAMVSLMLNVSLVHADEVILTTQERPNCDNQKLVVASHLLKVKEKTFSDAYSSTYESCNPLLKILALQDEKLFNIKDLKYKGGFKLSHRETSKELYASLRGSMGIFTYDERKGTLFVVGDPRGNNIGEFQFPEIVQSTDVDDFKTGDIIQNFTNFHNTKRIDTGIENYFRVTGLETVDNSLVVNYINWYDASGRETDTTIFFWDADKLQASALYGPYQLQGEAKAAGWISPIPEKYHELFEGTHITGSQPYASIISRLSIGPSAHVINLRREILYGPTGIAETETLLEFPFQHFLRDKKVYPTSKSIESILTNEDLKNKLWTSLSGAAYGVMIPGTRTYLTVGKSAGHESGIGYKITQDTGRQCSGPCPRVASDQYSFYWLWDMVDLLKVKLGVEKAYNVRPYDYGVLNVPFETINGVSGGSIDRKNKRLILSIKDGIQSTRYSRTPAFIVYTY